MGRKEGGALLGGIAQDQNGPCDTVGTELKRFLNIGNGKEVGAKLLIKPPKRHRSVSVGIGFDDTAELRFLGNRLPDGKIILSDGVQIHLRPGTAADPLRLFHKLHSFP